MAELLTDLMGSASHPFGSDARITGRETVSASCRDITTAMPDANRASWCAVTAAAQSLPCGTECLETVSGSNCSSFKGGKSSITIKGSFFGRELT